MTENSPELGSREDLEPDIPRRLDMSWRDEDHRRAEVTLEELVTDAGDEAFREVALVTPAWLEEAEPEPPPAGAMAIGVASNVVHMRAIAKLYHAMGGRVLESPGWETRGRGPMSPGWCVIHHTAAEHDIDGMLIEGRPDLSGPLCNFAFHRDATLVLIASGRANHAGVASVSSDESYGIEATGPVPVSASGPGAFPQYAGYAKLAAAVRIHHGSWTTGRVVGHKEIALPAGRKVDPMFAMGAFRTAVAAEVTRYHQHIAPTPEEWLDMATQAEVQAAFVAALREAGPEIVEKGMLRFMAPPHGVIAGQDHPADYVRVMADRTAKLLTAMYEVRDALQEGATPPA
jgi:hypothetical protein